MSLLLCALHQKNSSQWAIVRNFRCPLRCQVLADGYSGIATMAESWRVLGYCPRCQTSDARSLMLDVLFPNGTRYHSMMVTPSALCGAKT